MHIVFGYNLKCAPMTLNKVLNNSGLNSKVIYKFKCNVLKCNLRSITNKVCQGKVLYASCKHSM